MTANQVIEYFKQQYPNRRIIKLPQISPTEIICEIDPTEEHANRSVAIVAIETSAPHYHRESTETYEVITGSLQLHAGGEDVTLKAGDTHTIKPGTIHSAEGQFTLIKATSYPGWTQEDHILVR